MPKIVSYSLSATAVRLAPPTDAAGFLDDVSGAFVTPATPTIGLGESDTSFANAVQLPADSPVKVTT